MITTNGYSKNPTIIPEGIVLTLPVKFFEERGMSIDQFKSLFEEHMKEEDAYWNFRLTNLPTQEVLYVYLVFNNYLQYRCNFISYERNKYKMFIDSADGKLREFPNANWVLFTGPVIKPPEPISLKGFQGFRYCTKLF